MDDGRPDEAELDDEMPTGAAYNRDGAGRFAPGGAGGPGRMPRRGLEQYVRAAKVLSPRSSINGLTVMSASAPEVAARCIKIATRSRNEAHALKAAELVLSYAHGLPIQSIAMAHTDLNAPGLGERTERAHAALEALRGMINPVLVEDRTSDTPD